ncbi:sugar kinase [Phenylobacterium sp. LjRoot225]|uniref:sugar kinase n=1 Tax=Phenylobacterium sp. LjRoot225 TaxID=3342285 RepID=UPI003ED062E9
MKRAICIGECMVELRPAGEDLYRRGFAGDVYNTAVYLKRSDPALDVQFATVTGADPLSQAMRRAWAGEGVGDALAATDPGGRPGLYMIELDPRGERSFRYWRGESAARGWARTLAARIRNGALDRASLVYLSGISLAILTPEDRALALELVAELKSRGSLIAFDPNLRPALWGDLRPARAAFEAMAPLADILLPSQQDLETLFGDADIEWMAQRLQELGAAEFAITAEAQGCLVHRGRSEFITAPRVETVVDTSGAGDSFNGAYLAARLANRSPADAARSGLALAAYVVTQTGAIAAEQPDGPFADA